MDRYLIRGFVDGLLSTLGIVIGASAVIGAGEVNGSSIIIAAGLGGGVANGLSNVLGAFMGEKAALYERYQKVEKAMLKEGAIKDSKVDEKLQDRILTSGAADGLATMLGALIPIVPFFLASFPAITPIKSLYIAVGVSIALFFSLGAYIGRISKENMVFSGLKMAAFGGATALVVTVIRIFI